MEFMREIPDKFFDLACVDPPYGISINANMGRRKGKRKKHKDAEWDNNIPTDDYFDELFRVSKNQIIWGGNYYPLPLTKSWLFWDKLVPDGLSFADGELAWTSFDKTLVKIKLKYSGSNGADADCRIHPTQKPIALYRWILTNYAKPGNKIFDSHMGSQSSRIAAYDLGFDYWGCELDTDYFNDGCNRFNNHISQLRIDIPVQPNVKQNKLF